MYAVFHPPNFAVQVAAKQRPEQRKRAFALVDGEPPAQVVITANKAARAAGVEDGMTKLQAETIPGVTVVRRMPEDEASALAVLHTVACMFSPRIEYVEEAAGTYALDIRGMSGLFGDEAQLANKLRQCIMGAGFLANIAVAQNFDAAVCLARGRERVSVVPPEFLCTGEIPTESSPAPLEFTVSDQALKRSVRQASIEAPHVLTKPLIDDIRRRAAEAEAVQKGGNSRYA